MAEMETFQLLQF